MRRKQRRKRKYRVPADGLEAEGSNKSFLRATDLHTRKRQKVEVPETETERMPAEETPVECREADSSRDSQVYPNGDADQHLGEIVAVVKGLSPENTCSDPVDLDYSSVNGSLEDEEESVVKMNIQVDSCIFLDDDSNQVLPVGQFFGNIELVQDYPPRTPTSVSMSRREYRRLHYIAKDDSDEEDIYEDSQPETQQQNDSFSSTTQSGSTIRNGRRGSASQKES
ncbi:hypothetical protein AGOR_G00135080 [Albula goreensis]|uniref:CA174 protein n=1 Tax=Albula goreensis TaxID=1534307 RepID=A0A8T3D4Q8_9TELE|nr:hypothetical protein AGOR_G00135080 [Albula goreensis]